VARRTQYRLSSLERYDLDNSSALSFLMRLSQNDNIKLRYIAQQILEQANQAIGRVYPHSTRGKTSTRLDGRPVDPSSPGAGVKTTSASAVLKAPSPAQTKGRTLAVGSRPSGRVRLMGPGRWLADVRRDPLADDPRGVSAILVSTTGEPRP
jgi:hypothetical protein